MLRPLILALCLVVHLISAQCGPGSIYQQSNSRCLTLFRAAVNFQTAESICATLSGHLVSIHNAIDNAFVSSQAQKYMDGGAWIGAQASAPDVTNPLNWYWTDGSNFDYQNYKVGQPTPPGSTACMQLETGTAKWQTANCTNKLPFICSAAATVVPTCPTITIPSHCPSGYTWFETTDFCYKTTVQFTNFNDARSACQADGGDLASIHSIAENAFLVGLSKAGITNKDKDWNDDVWIGLVYQNSKWQWTDGSVVNYVNWGDGEPNNMNKEWWTALVADPHEGKNSEGTRWNNVPQDDQRAFLCKIAPLH
ncbi:C-type lectin domain-containing protein [Caenorhabditis elegans]|uniref:C-type lectin domain-containing protein n=1 Tax=Caenorhabditis elegans TaxID=6239 RepID=P91429_CAEEL|nr:C-type lectin domain-containing protein [Caenorhabditis elegans]CCD67798.1 C-type lectin domain-containing protein [Caenorhabditis elegans]|eukprot:NP_491247.2 C-type LECtin [Caenorhabditis elegans]